MSEWSIVWPVNRKYAKAPGQLSDIYFCHNCSLELIKVVAFIRSIYNLYIYFRHIRILIKAKHKQASNICFAIYCTFPSYSNIPTAKVDDKI